MSRSAGYPGSRKKLEKMLGDAHQELRDLKNEHHAALVVLDDLKKEFQQLLGSIRQQAVALATRQQVMSDAELTGLAAIVIGENRQPTEAFLRLCGEMAGRGHVVSGKDSAAAGLLRELSAVWGSQDHAVVGHTDRAKNIIERLVAIGGGL